MSAPELFEAHKPQDCESHVLQIIKDETRKLRDSIAAHLTFDKTQKAEARRYRDPREHDPDYGQRLRELEGQIAEIDRGQSGFHNNNHPRPPKSESWQNKVLIGVAIAVISAAIISAVTTYTAVAALTTEVQMYIQANDKRLDGDEARIHDTERRLDRGAP